MTTLPTLFVSHGAPTAALLTDGVAAQWRALGERLRPLQPRAVLAVSPHWSSARPQVATRDPQVAWHDFGGFAPELYELRYDPPGAPALATRVVELLQAAGVACGSDAQRPLDHGVWVPLRSMFATADLPVTQLSLQPQQSPAAQFALGRALAPLAAEGVLLLATGSFTHNLHEVDFRQPAGAPDPYVTEFRTWIFERLAAHDLDALLDYRRRAPHALRSHPTDEHLLPLFVAMGAADDWTQWRAVADGTTYRVLAMDGFEFGSASG